MLNWIEYTSNWRGLDFGNLEVDQAFLQTKSFYNKSVWLYILSENCFTCPHERQKIIKSGHDDVSELDTAYRLSIKVFDNDIGLYDFENETSLCNLKLFTLGEFGVYNLTVANNGSCNFEIDKEPVNIYLPMLLVFLILLAFFALLKGYLLVYKKFTRNHATTEEEVNCTKKRLNSIDTFRGLAITLMIFVNSGGGHYWWMKHATWNGLHVADIVFPSFLWIMGVCLPISIRSQINRGVSKLHILKNIFWRSAKLFLIGLCLNSVNGPKLEFLRIMGVLQRFGLSYLVCASIHTIFYQPYQEIPQTKVWKLLSDILIMKFEWFFGIMFIGIYFLLTFGIKPPDCPRGYLGPGGKHNMANYTKCAGGIAGYVDRVILTENHMYQHSTSRNVYNSPVFDPEGIFGCILSIVLVIIGIQCGITLMIINNPKSRIGRWLTWSLVFGLLGGILCSFSKENGWIPVNKNLWSLSFVCVTSCFAFAIFSLCYFIVDVKFFWSGYPFREAGMNSIIMYVGHSILHKILPWHWRIGNMNTHFVLLLECIWNTSIWIAIALYLHKSKIFYNL